MTPEQINALVPQLERTFEELDQVRERARAIKRRMDLLEMIHGEHLLETPGPDRAEYHQCLEAIERERREFDAIVARITELGGTVKGIDEGLVDFYGVVDGHLVWMCWKRGEPEVCYYHHLDEGAAGRTPLPGR